MKVTILRFEGPDAICMKEDSRLIDIKRFNIPIEAEEGDILNVEESTITIENKIIKEKYIHVDDVILDHWQKK